MYICTYVNIAHDTPPLIYSSAKEPCTSTKEANRSSKKPYESAKEPNTSAERCLQIRKRHKRSHLNVS